MNPIRVTFNAALNNPNDSREVTLVADAVGVGRTHRLATGQIITWTAELLREKAKTFIGMPVNIDLDEEDEPTGHSRRAVGAITHAFFDERKQVVTVTAALWRHYAPHTVERIKELANDPNARNRIQVSMEFIPEGEMVANADGSETPVDGEFSGLGIVRVGADPRNKVILVAAIAEDEAAKEPMSTLDEILSQVRTRFGLTEVKTPEEERDEINAELAAAHEGSLEWTSRRLAEHLAERRGSDYDAPYCYVIATYPKYAIYQEGDNYYRVEYTRKGRSLEFGEPAEVDPTYTPVEATASQDDADPAQTEVAALGTELSEEQKAELRAELLAEVQPQLDELATVKAERDTLLAEKATAAEAEAKKELVATRMAELEIISPAEGDSKARREALCAALDDEAFATYKADLADTAATKGGLATDGERHAGTEEAEEGGLTEEQIAAMAGRALAAAGHAAPAKDK